MKYWKTTTTTRWRKEYFLFLIFFVFLCWVCVVARHRWEWDATNCENKQPTRVECAANSRSLLWRNKCKYEFFGKQNGSEVRWEKGLFSRILEI